METITSKNRSWLADRRTLIYLLIFLIGVSIMLYPVVSNLWNKHVFQMQVSSYDETVRSGQVDLAKEMDTARQYNNALSPKEVPDAFSVHEGKSDARYESILDLDENGMMGYVSIPSINVELPIYHYTNETTLKKGVGHLFGSSLPVGGKGTHTVLSAHRGLPSAKMFTDLNLLEAGDSFYIHILDKRLKYQVDRIDVVKPDETESLGIEEEKDLATLVTCTPYGVNTHRLLVREHRVADDKDSSEPFKFAGKRILITILCILAGIVLAYLISKLLDKRGKRGKDEI